MPSCSRRSSPRNISGNTPLLRVNRAGWRVIGGKRKYFRSQWEANYARVLEFLKTRGEILDWHHEPKTFWFPRLKRGAVSYLPDFHVLEPGGRESYHEVKGWMDARSRTKIRRMAKFFPAVTLVVIGARDYRSLVKSLSALIPDWEHGELPAVEPSGDPEKDRLAAAIKKRYGIVIPIDRIHT